MPWFVLRCHVRRELPAHGELQDRGFNSMVPMEHVIVHPSRHSKRRELRSRPLLFGYLFIEAEELPWQEIKGIPGVYGFISDQDGDPYALRQADVDRLIALSNLEPVPDNDPDRPFRLGDDAIIVSGPFQGRTIRVKDIVGRKAMAMMRMFGSMKTIEIAVSALKQGPPSEVRKV